MDRELLKRKPSTKPPRIASEEETNREGNWTRQFTVRSELWPIVEHWANEQGFHLAAARGQQRRLYHRGWDPKLVISVLDIKNNDGVVTLSGWIQVGWRARLLSLFTLPSRMPVDATGYRGASFRRQFCHELNVLLERLRQPHIADSHGIHVADLDVTSRILSLGVIVATTTFLVLTLLRLEVRPDLSPQLLIAFAKLFGFLVGGAMIFVLIHQFLILRFVEKRPLHFVSASLGLLFHTFLSVLTFTDTSHTMNQDKLTYYCLSQFQAERCESLVKGLSPKDRNSLQERVNFLERELVKRP